MRGRRRKTKENPIHAELLSEWLGCEKPTDLKKNISAAGNHITQVLTQNFFNESLDEDALKDAWKDTAGEFVAANSIPVSAKNGHLVLQVTQSAVRFHLEQTKPDLLKRLQTRFGPGKIKSIKFQHG